MCARFVCHTTNTQNIYLCVRDEYLLCKERMGHDGFDENEFQF